jgi:tetratricopeptide (TPR) repeat protein
MKKSLKLRQSALSQSRWCLFAIIVVAPLLFVRVFAASENETQVSKFENRLFFRDYDGESLSDRLSRIEKQIFGETFTGSIEERVSRIATSLPPEKRKPAPPPMAPAPAPTPSAASQPQTMQEDEETEAERKRAAVMAAREEEVAKLLAEGVEAYRAKNTAMAINRFQQVVRLDPQNAQAYYSLGIAMEANNSFGEALKCYEHASAIDPSNKDYVQALKLTEKKAVGEKKEIEKDAQLKRLSDEAAQAYRNQQFISALDLYKQLDERRPNNANTKFNIGTVYLSMNHYASAIDYYREACKLKPDEPKYAEALQRLEANVSKDENERLGAERTWENSHPQQNNKGSRRSNNSPPQNNSPSNGPPQNNPPANNLSSNDRPSRDPIESFGFSLKGTKDGLKISKLKEQQRAAKVGLKEGDLIKAVDGNIVTSIDQMRKLVQAKPSNARFQLTVQRNNRLGQILL